MEKIENDTTKLDFTAEEMEHLDWLERCKSGAACEAECQYYESRQDRYIALRKPQNQNESM